MGRNRLQGDLYDREVQGPRVKVLKKVGMDETPPLEGSNDSLCTSPSGHERLTDEIIGSYQPEST